MTSSTKLGQYSDQNQVPTYLRILQEFFKRASVFQNEIHVFTVFSRLFLQLLKEVAALFAAFPPSWGVLPWFKDFRYPDSKPGESYKKMFIKYLEDWCQSTRIFKDLQGSAGVLAMDMVAIGLAKSGPAKTITCSSKVLIHSCVR